MAATIMLMAMLLMKTLMANNNIFNLFEHFLSSCDQDSKERYLASIVGGVLSLFWSTTRLSDWLLLIFENVHCQIAKGTTGQGIERFCINCQIKY